TALLCIVAFMGAERRALVIGNANYTEGRLKNPVNDARAVGALLRNLGFETTVKTDLNRRNFDAAIETFIASLRSQDEAFLYYSGHGVQIDGENYLLPLGQNFKDPTDVKYDAINANKISEKLSRVAVSLIVLDACRDNPFQFYRSGAHRGLALMNLPPTGQYVVYSTASGQVAADGGGELSPFTQAFVTHAPTPNISIDEVMRRVSREVREASNNKQTPYVYGFFDSEYYLASSLSMPEERRTQTTTPRVSRPSTEIEVLTGDLRITTDFKTEIWINNEKKEELNPNHSLTLRNLVIGSYTVESITSTAKYGYIVQIYENQQTNLNIRSSDPYLQSLSSFTISSEPSPCKLTIEGYAGLELLTPFLIFDPHSHDYSLSFSSAHYEPATHRITTDPRVNKKHLQKLKPTFPSISINSYPYIGKVYLDGKYIGTTSLKYDQQKTLAPGQHKIKVESINLDYGEMEKDITLIVGETYEDTFQLPFIGAWLSVKADHYPIAVYLNGVRNFDLESGKKIMIHGWDMDKPLQYSFKDKNKINQQTSGYQRHIRVEYTGINLQYHKPYEAMLDLKAQDNLNLDLKLAVPIIKVKFVSNQTKANYTIINQENGGSHNPKNDHSLELPEGKYQVEASSFGYYTKSIPLDLIDTGTIREQKIEFEPLPKHFVGSYKGWKNLKSASVIGALASIGFSTYSYFNAEKCYQDYLKADNYESAFDKRQQFLKAQTLFNTSLYINILPVASYLLSLNRSQAARKRINIEASKRIN
ncbi:MAG: caspase family protein, partial [Candidatus Cloacimonetes bacterium]|nr:caspase family protein [Candidatus Cloacimonadota bacterium]